MKNINEKELTNFILKRLQEGYFDEFEFDKDAMQAAMTDIKADDTAGEFEEIGTSQFEKDPEFKNKLKSSLKQANLELPSDEAEVEHYVELLKKRKAQEDRFGKGSLNEDNTMNEEAYEASRYMFFSNLQQIRRQAGLLLDMDEDKLQEILENGHDWAQDHIATAKESIDQVFDFLMNETNGGDMWKSVDVEDKEGEKDEEEEEDFDEEIEEGAGRSHVIGRGANKKPVDYPETLMREAIKDVMEGMFDKYTSTTSTSGQFSKGGGFKKQPLTTMLDSLSKWMESTFKNKFIIKKEMPQQTTDKSPDAKKPIVYIWIPTNNPNAINVEYRNITSAVNYVTTNKHIEKILNKFKTLGVLVQLMKGKDATQAKFSLAMKQTGAQAEPATNQPATTQNQTPQPAVTEGYSVNEDEHIKLSFADKLKLWAKGISEEKALENLNAGLPIDWAGSVEGYYEKDEPSRDYSGTNEAVEEGFLSKSKTTLQNPEQYIKNTTKDKLIQAIKKMMSNFGGGVNSRGETPMSRIQKQFWTGSDNDWDAFVDMAMNMKESSSDSLQNKHGKNAKPNVSYLKKEGYENIIELQDNQANHVFTLLKQDGPEEAIEYLKEFHKPGTHNILSEIKKSALDKSYEKDGYTLTWNPSVGFVKLSYKTN